MFVDPKSGAMGGDNERSEAGTAPSWLSPEQQHQQQQQHREENAARETNSTSTSGFGTSYSPGARKKSGAASVGLPNRCFQAIEAHSSGVNDVVFEKGGVLLATAGDDSYVKVWDSGSGRQRAALKVSLYWCVCVCVGGVSSGLSQHVSTCVWRSP